MRPSSTQAPQGMLHPMRRSEREIERTEAERLLLQCEYGILSTCGNDGVPYGVPVSYVFDGQRIAFHCADKGHKVQNMQENAAACFTVVGRTKVLPGKFSTRYESAIAFGYISRADGERKIQLLRSLAEKYCPDFREKAAAYIRHDAAQTAVFELEIVRLSGKAHR